MKKVTLDKKVEKKDKTSAIEKRLQKMEIRFDQGEEFVVVDLGSGFIKVGFSGEDLPRVVIPTCMGEKLADEAAQNGEGKKDTKSNKYGVEAFAANMKDDVYDLHYPIQRGIVVDTDRTTKMLEYIFEKQMNLDVKSINVLITDSPFNTKRHKQELAEIMLDYFKVKSFSLMNTAVLSLFSTGKTCGLVAECGDGISCTVPVFEGYALPHAMHYIPVAGQDVTKKLMEELMLTEPVKEKHSQYVRDIKE